MKNGLKDFIGSKKVGITLGSGGAKGISHIGVLEVLEESGVIINEISGCSIGSIIGAAYASGMPIEELKIPFRCVATNVGTGEQEIFDSGDLIPAIRASISIPGFFVPMRYQGKLLVDGGIVNSLPVDLLCDSDFKIATIVEEYRKL